MPGYLAKQEALKAAGVDEVLVFCVNDGAVMGAWARQQRIAGSNIAFMADPSGRYTKALGLELTDAGPKAIFGPQPRCKRFAAYCDDAVVRVLKVSESAGDPAGDDFPEESCVENMLECIAQL